jgi:hypothetical protein
MVGRCPKKCSLQAVMNRILLLFLVSIISAGPLFGANHQEIFIGTGNSHDSAEQDAKSQASPHGGVSSVVSIDTKQTAPNTWVCVLKTIVSN